MNDTKEEEEVGIFKEIWEDTRLSTRIIKVCIFLWLIGVIVLTIQNVLALLVKTGVIN